MLYLVTKTGQEFTAHVGDLFSRSLVREDVVEVQADGDELQYLLTECDGVKNSGKQVQKWHDDDAQYVVNQLFAPFNKQIS